MLLTLKDVQIYHFILGLIHLWTDQAYLITSRTSIQNEIVCSTSV